MAAPGAGGGGDDGGDGARHGPQGGGRLRGTARPVLSPDDDR